MQAHLDKQATFKAVMGSYPTGVTIITTKTEEGVPIGLTVNSFASVSLDPLLVLWSIDHSASSLEVFKQAKKFAVNILSSNQTEQCQLFASKEKNRFDHCSWHSSNHDLPILEDSLATLQCEVYQLVEAGDHTIVIGKVIEIDKHEKEPLLYHRRTFGAIPSSFYK